MTYAETVPRPRHQADLVPHKQYVAAAVVVAAAALGQLVVVGVTAADLTDIADDDGAVVVAAAAQMTPFADAADWNLKNNTDWFERPDQHLVLPLSYWYQRYGTDYRPR